MWIHLPSSVSIPVVEDSTSDSEWLFQMLASSVTWRGMLRPSKSWLRICKREGWMKHRSGLIPGPLTASRGVESWIGSLAASRASRGQSQERREEPMMNAGSGPTSDASLAKWNPEDCSWRTYQASFWEESSQYLESWPRTGMTRSGQLFGLPTLVRHIDGSGALSWATPVGHDHKSEKSTLGRSLGRKTQVWPTATALDRPRTPETMAKSAAFRKRNANQNTVPLYLGEVAAEWQTWGTPQASDHKGPNLSKGSSSSTHMLAAKAHRWNTPQDLKMPMAGDNSSKETRRLNPRFVEMLMGWPLGWTDFESSGMELSRSKPPSPSTSCGSR